MPIALFIETMSLQYFPLFASEMKTLYSSLGHVSLRIIFSLYNSGMHFATQSGNLWSDWWYLIPYSFSKYSVSESLQSYQIVTAIDI